MHEYITVTGIIHGSNDVGLHTSIQSKFGQIFLEKQSLLINLPVYFLQMQIITRLIFKSYEIHILQMSVHSGIQ